jgi:hypothetical protein
VLYGLVGTLASCLSFQRFATMRHMTQCIPSTSPAPRAVALLRRSLCSQWKFCWIMLCILQQMGPRSSMSLPMSLVSNSFTSIMLYSSGVVGPAGPIMRWDAYSWYISLPTLPVLMRVLAFCRVRDGWQCAFRGQTSDLYCFQEGAAPRRLATMRRSMRCTRQCSRTLEAP